MPYSIFNICLTISPDLFNMNINININIIVSDNLLCN